MLSRVTQKSRRVQTAASPSSHPSASKGDPEKNPPTKFPVSEEASAPAHGRGKPSEGLVTNSETSFERPNEQHNQQERYQMKEEIPTTTSPPSSTVSTEVPISSWTEPREFAPAGSTYQGSPNSQEEGGIPGPTTIGGNTMNMASGENAPSTSSNVEGGPPSPAGTSATQWTINTVRRDHDLVKQNLERLLSLTDSGEKQRLFNDTVKMLAQHDVAEEVVSSSI